MNPPQKPPRNHTSTERLLELPLRYAEHGLFIFPVARGTKDRPLTPHGFKDASRNPDHIRAWIGRFGETNWALWPAASGLIVIDWETAAGEGTMRDWRLWDVSTLRVLSARGAHHYFATPTVDIQTDTLGAGTTIRHRKGYSMLPPSLHPSGYRYRWEGTVEDLQPLPASVLIRLKAMEATKAKREATPITMVSTKTIWTAPTDGLVRRVQGYLDRLPTGLVDGEGRNRVAYGFGAWLLRDLQLSESLARRYLDQWNHRQAEPLSERELATVMVNTIKYGRRPYGVAHAVDWSHSRPARGFSAEAGR